MDTDNIFIVCGTIVALTVIATVTFGVYNAGQRELAIQQACVARGNQFISNNSGLSCLRIAPLKQGDVPSRD